MALLYMGGSRITGTNADRTGGTWTNLNAGWEFTETDTNPPLKYFWTGSVWRLITESAVAETLTSKTLTSPAVNTPTINYTDVTKVFSDSPYTIAAGDNLIRADGTSGALIVTLPTAVGITGKEYTIKRIDLIASSNIVKVATTSSQTISLAAAWYLWPQEYVTVRSNGANWEAINYSNPSQAGYFFLGGSTPNRRYIAGMMPDNTGALSTSTTSPLANLLWALPLLVGKVTKFDLITFNVTTGAAINARAGIYRDSGNGYPGALIFDTGAIDCTAAVEKTTTITAGLQIFQPGLYWLAWECASNTIQIRILPINSEWGILTNTGTVNPPSYGYSVAHTFGALPDPYTVGASVLTAAVSASAPVPAIMLRAI